MRIRHCHHEETDRAAEKNLSSNDVVDTTLSLLSPSIFSVPEKIKSAEQQQHLEAATTINLANFRDESVKGFLGLGITANCSRNCKKDSSFNGQASNLFDKSVKEFDASSGVLGLGIDGDSSIQDRRKVAVTLIPGSNHDRARPCSNNKIGHRRRRITALNPQTAPKNKRALDEFLEKEEERAPESQKRLKTRHWGDGVWSRFGLGLETEKEEERAPESNKLLKTTQWGDGVWSRFGLETNQSRVFKRCSILLGRLMKHKYSWVFNDPVDAKALGLPDYHDIVEHPMDLGTINTNLSLNRYNSPLDFAEDVRLVFRNAMAYNPEGHDVHIMAQQLSEVFEQQWAIMNTESSSGRAPPLGSAPPVSETRQIGRKPDEYPEPINPPEELVQLIGPDITPVFVYRKQLAESDTRKGRNRLFVNDREKLMDFMTGEERRAVRDGKKPGIDLIGIDRMGREYKLHSNKWGSLDIALLNKEWHKIVVANQAKKGDWVRLWAYRRAETVGFCLFVEFRDQP